ncbi:MAG: hypothetical protein MR434_06385 [Ruminococcus sp.]|nr:hypothetical protein [Ruminococcus sp.]
MIGDVSHAEHIYIVCGELFMTDDLLELQKEIRREFSEFDTDHVMTPEEDERCWREILEVID